MKLKIILFVIVILTVSSCYTVLKHPAVPSEDKMGNVYHQNISSNENCYKCHTEDNQEIQDYNRYSNYYTETETHEQNVKSRWDSYYSVPWWFTPQVTVSAGGGAGSTGIGGPIKNNNKTTTSTPESSRTTGSTRTEVNINVPPPTTNSNSNSNTNSGNSTSEENNQSSSSGRSNNSNSEDKRNTGSTRGK